jgi:hypothetical protein
MKPPKQNLTPKQLQRVAIAESFKKELETLAVTNPILISPELSTENVGVDEYFTPEQEQDRPEPLDDATSQLLTDQLDNEILEDGGHTNLSKSCLKDGLTENKSGGKHGNKGNQRGRIQKSIITGHSVAQCWYNILLESEKAKLPYQKRTDEQLIEVMHTHFPNGKHIYNGTAPYGGKELAVARAKYNSGKLLPGVPAPKDSLRSKKYVRSENGTVYVYGDRKEFLGVYVYTLPPEQPKQPQLL